MTFLDLTADQIAVFLMGYDTRHAEVMAAVVTAGTDHKSAPLAVRESYRRSEWELKAAAQIRANRKAQDDNTAYRERITARVRDLDHVIALRR